jgi:hypothetical protein
MDFVSNWMVLLKIFDGVSPKIKSANSHSNLGNPYVRVALDSDL